MAHRDHPERTSVYGVLVIIVAMMAGLAVSVWSHPGPAVRIPVLVVALVAAVIGVGMTLRDLPPPS